MSALILLIAAFALPQFFDVPAGLALVFQIAALAAALAAIITEMLDIILKRHRQYLGSTQSQG